MGARVASSVDPWYLNLRLTTPELRAIGATWSAAPAAGSLVAAEGGVLPAAGFGEFNATSNGTTSAPRVAVDPGRCVVPDTANYGWPCVWPTQQNVLLTPPETNPRVDLLVARVLSAAEFGDPVTGFYVESVDGVAAASPVAPAVPARALDLWSTRVNTDGTVVLTDRRKRTRAPGGLRISTNDTARAGSHPGDLRIDPTTGQIDGWIGGAWVPLSTVAGGKALFSRSTAQTIPNTAVTRLAFTVTDNASADVTKTAHADGGSIFTLNRAGWWRIILNGGFTGDPDGLIRTFMIGLASTPGLPRWGQDAKAPASFYSAHSTSVERPYTAGTQISGYVFHDAANPLDTDIVQTQMSISFAWTGLL